MWCSDNNLVLNTTKTKEVILEFRRSRKTTPSPFYISGEEVKKLDCIKLLGLHITKDLT